MWTVGVSESEDQNDTDEESATDNEPDEKDESRETNEVVNCLTFYVRKFFLIHSWK